MAEDMTSGVTITLKGGQGYDSPWIVIHAADVNEAGIILEELREKEVFETVKMASAEFIGSPVSMSQAVRDIQNAFPGSQTHAPGQVYAGQGQQLPQQYQPGGQAEQCPHGAMQYVANGKYGPFWACPLPRNAPGKCKARNA